MAVALNRLNWSISCSVVGSVGSAVRTPAAAEYTHATSEGRREGTQPAKAASMCCTVAMLLEHSSCMHYIAAPLASQAAAAWLWVAASSGAKASGRCSIVHVTHTCRASAASSGAKVCGRCGCAYVRVERKRAAGIRSEQQGSGAINRAEARVRFSRRCHRCDGRLELTALLAGLDPLHSDHRDAPQPAERTQSSCAEAAPRRGTGWSEAGRAWQRGIWRWQWRWRGRR